MKFLQKITFAIIAICSGVLSISNTSNAQSGALYSAPFILYTGNGISCSIVNISAKERQVEIEILSSKSPLSDEVETIDYEVYSLKPGTTGNVSAGCLENCGDVYCKFSVQGSKRSFRGIACLEKPDTGDMTCITAQ